MQSGLCNCKPKFTLPGPGRPGGLQGPASQSQGPRRPLHEWPPVKSALPIASLRGYYSGISISVKTAPKETGLWATGREGADVTSRGRSFRIRAQVTRQTITYTTSGTRRSPRHCHVLRKLTGNVPRSARQKCDGFLQFRSTAWQQFLRQTRGRIPQRYKNFPIRTVIPMTTKI